MPCGGRDLAFDQFKNALRAAKADEVCALLVDSEGNVEAGDPVAHLSTRDKWRFPALNRNRVFLMVQAMEAWFLADREALASFYDGGFLANSLPGNPNIEAISKEDLEPALKHASKPTKTKGEYHKVKHGFALLAAINPAKVERASPHAAALHEFLRAL
ncbi:MAG: DUF4276 family protein [Terracidiphilus sp.]